MDSEPVVYYQKQEVIPDYAKQEMVRYDETPEDGPIFEKVDRRATKDRTTIKIKARR